jgi:hypothetical protein
MRRPLTIIGWRWLFCSIRRRGSEFVECCYLLLENLFSSLLVRSFMDSGRQPAGPPEWMIPLGGSVFVAVLGISAYWESGDLGLGFGQFLASPTNIASEIIDQIRTIEYPCRSRRHSQATGSYSVHGRSGHQGTLWVGRQRTCGTTVRSLTMPVGRSVAR